ncbi:MAG: DNA polymerase IV [Parcubacteria group bacterium]
MWSVLIQWRVVGAAWFPANYAARAYGIRSALPISKAWQFSQAAVRKGLPEAIFVTPDFRKYSKASQAVMAIIQKYSAVMQQASVDEAYFDLSHVGSFEKATEVCREIKALIKTQERITASIGFGPNKLIAKIASDMQKPDGLTVIIPEKVEEFLEPLSIRKIPGIGPKTEEQLNKLKIYKVQDLKKYSQMQLQEMLGKWGVALFFKIRGIDDSEVVEEYEAKSIGEQETFFEDTLDFKTVMEKLEGLCQGVFCSFQESDFKTFQNVTITVRFADFATKTRSHTLKKSEKTLKALKQESMKLIFPFFDARENPRKKRIRLIGVRVEKLK